VTVHPYGEELVGPQGWSHKARGCQAEKNGVNFIDALLFLPNLIVEPLTPSRGGGRVESQVCRPGRRGCFHYS